MDPPVLTEEKSNPVIFDEFWIWKKHEFKQLGFNMDMLGLTHWGLFSTKKT